MVSQQTLRFILKISRVGKTNVDMLFIKHLGLTWRQNLTGVAARIGKSIHLLKFSNSLHGVLEKFF